MKPLAPSIVPGTRILFSLSLTGGEGRGEGEDRAMASRFRLHEQFTHSACGHAWKRIAFASRPLTLPLSPDGGAEARHSTPLRFLP